MGREPERYAPLDRDFRETVLGHFKGNVQRAFKELRPDVHYFRGDEDVAISLSTFYKIMRGHDCTPAQLEKMELVWLQCDKANPPPSVPDDMPGVKRWLRDHFGSLQKAQCHLFPDWPYSTFANSLNGYLPQRRSIEVLQKVKVFREELFAEWQRKREEADEAWKAQRLRGEEG